MKPFIWPFKNPPFEAGFLCGMLNGLPMLKTGLVMKIEGR
jgi:hypothetical protein